MDINEVTQFLLTQGSTIPIYQDCMLTRKYKSRTLFENISKKQEVLEELSYKKIILEETTENLIRLNSLVNNDMNSNTHDELLAYSLEIFLKTSNRYTVLLIKNKLLENII